MRLKKMFAVAAVAAAALTVSACSAGDPNAEKFVNGSGNNYVSATYQVVKIPEADRGKPISFAGETEHGSKIDSKELLGNIVVVNFWYAGCGPCRIEAPILETVHQENSDKPVQFVGVNTTDLADTALSFARDYKVSYHSILDVKSGAVEFAFAAATPMTATPTTIILDKLGRPAVRIIGAIPDVSILRSLVKDLSEAS